MRTVRTLASIAVAVPLSLTLSLMLLGACGDDSSSATDSTVGGATTTTAQSATTLAATGGTTAPQIPSTEVLSGPVQIDVVVGVDSGADRIERVTVGSEITLNITNPNADDEFHVHGVDIEQKAKAGQMATINFTIDEPGTYEVESHITEDVLVIIEAT